MNIDFIPVLLILIPIIIGVIIYITHHYKFNMLIFLAQSIVTGLALRYYLYYDKFYGEVFLNLGNWSEKISIVLKNDYLSMTFIFLTIIMWWMVIIYSWKERKRDSKFYFFLLFLEGVFFGLLQTNDIFNLFVFIEITTIISTILILYKMSGESVRAGLYYLLFNSVGIMFFLIGMAFIYYSEGTLNINILTERINILQGLNLTNLSYISIMAAVGVKSAFFPVYNWLPKAHSAAPSVISALLSGLLVKSGLYVFIRINSMYGLETFREFFIILGLFTAISGGIFALSQKDIKQILAFSTVSQIGIIMIGLNQVDGNIIGGILHIINHAFFKSMLFLSAGIIIKTYKEKDTTVIRGILHELPLIGIFILVGFFSISGMPFFNGYISKSIIKYGIYSEFVIYAIHFIDILTITYFMRILQILKESKELKVKYKIKSSDNSKIPVV
ncbi:MAG: proton-conducting transporter membrane subunit, partial [Bacillota bacterium]|nr:proton-conducting transporter membrane subunit [Bacillota bacterium]